MKKEDGRTVRSRRIKSAVTPELERLMDDARKDAPPVSKDIARRPPEPLVGTGGGRPTSERSEVLKEQALALFALGRNNSQIAREIGVTVKTVRKWRAEASRPEPERNSVGQIVGANNDLMTAEMIRMYQSEDKTYVQIAEELGVSYVTVRNRLKNVYAEYAAKMKEELVGKTFADFQVMKEELLAIIIRDASEEIGQARAELEAVDPEDTISFEAVIEKAYNKGRRNTDTKFKAMEVYIKIAEREAKLFGHDAASQMNINHTVKVEPEAIDLLQRINASRETQPDVIDVEIVSDEPLELGGL